MPRHPICIYLSPGGPKCQISESSTDKSRESLNQQEAEKLNDSLKRYSSKSASSAFRKIRRRPGLCNLRPEELLKQKIFNRHPSILQLRLKVPDNHPSTRLKHISRVADLRKAAGISPSNISATELPVVQTSLRVVNTIPGVMHTQTLEASTVVGNNLQGEPTLYGDDSEQWKLPPRVMVSNSMLQAYSEMRGNNDKRNWNFGPLHESLFLAERDLPGGDQLVLPAVNSQTPYPKGVCFYWDPASQQQKRFSKPVAPQDSPDSQNWSTQGISLQEFLDRAPPGSRIRHYKGEDGYGNYGHVYVNNTWVDPDSEGEVINALRDESSKISIPYAPIVSSGAKIMTPQEQTEFYRGYIREVSDSGDSEGDPRSLRIAPATYAQWAEGATKGHSYIDTEVPNPEPLVRKPRKDCPPVSRDLCNLWLEPQYDIDTGSIMSGCYEPAKEPSIIFSAEGVDLDHRPGNFSFSYPGVDDIIDRVAFGPNEESDRIRNWVAASIASHQDFILGTEGACNEFANPSDPTGIYQYEGARTYIETLGGLHKGVLEKSFQLKSVHNGLEYELYGIHQEFWFMRKELAHRAGVPEEDLPSIPANTLRPSDSSRHPTRPDTPRPVMAINRSNQSQRPGRHAVYFEEREQRELVNIKKAEFHGEKFEVNIQPIMDGIQLLTQMHDDMKALLSFSDDDASGLVPAPGDPERPT